MVVIQIDKGIAIPEKGKYARERHPEEYRKYPFNYMELGDSFLSEWPLWVSSKPDKTAFQSRIMRSAARVTEQSGRKFTSRIMDDGVRVWRIL